MRAIVVLCLAMSMTAPMKGSEPGNRTPFRSATGAFFALSVADMPESVRWYSEKLGLKPVMVEPKRDKIAVTVLKGSGLTVELIQHDDAAPQKGDPQMIHGIFKVGFVVTDFDETLSKLKARGVEIAYGPFPARDEQLKNVLIRDNSGNLIQIFGE